MSTEGSKTPVKGLFNDIELNEVVEFDGCLIREEITSNLENRLKEESDNTDATDGIFDAITEFGQTVKGEFKDGGILNRHDFAYAGRDVVNQVGKIVPSIIKDAIDNINNFAEQRLNRLISQGEKGAERVLPRVVRGALEDVYQTPFGLLGNFRKK